MPITKNLVVLLTQTCPLSCKHCVTDSGPDKAATLSEADVDRVVAGAARFGIESVCFSGGEPFARFNLLRYAVAATAAGGMRPTVATSGHWATSEDRARSLLSRLPQVAALGVSMDSFHAAETQEARPLTAIRVAVALGIAVEVQCSAFSKEEAVKLSQLLAAKVRPIVVHWQPTWPVQGAIKRGVVIPTVSGKARGELNLACPCGTAPVVGWNAKMYGCCSALLNLGDSHPLHLGDARDADVFDLLTAAERNRYYQFVRSPVGLRVLSDMASERGLNDSLRSRHFDACDFCYDLHTSPGLQGLLSEVREQLGPPH